MTQRLPAPSFRIASRLGKHHCAHLRAVAQGVPVIEAARRYLGIEHGHEAVTAHRAALDLASAVARRRGDSRWRLLGATLPPAALPVTVLPLEEWAAAEGLSDWSADELLSLYEEKFGAGGVGNSSGNGSGSGSGSGSGNNSSQRRRSARNARLQAARLALLHELEAQAADKPTPADALAGWLSPALAHELLERGVANLGELQALIVRGGRWWAGLRAYGPVKAARLQRQVEQLIGAPPARSWSLHLNAGRAERATALSGEHGANRAAPGVATIAARDDRAAVQAWIAARAGSTLTARAYEREADRFILWILLERRKALSDAGAEDCRAYMDFLAAVPAGWISRHHAPRLAPGWAPFAGPLSVASQRQAIGIVHSMFQWLVQAGYLRANPWALVRRRVGDDLEASAAGRSTDSVGESSRAFTPAAWKALQAQAGKDTEVPATAARMRWLLVFAEATGLRASELVNARRGHFARRQGAWWIRVLGKGARNRSVPVPSAAMKATMEYFASREVDFESAPDGIPLLASTTTPGQPLSYPALHKSFKSFVLRALRHSDLPAAQRREADAASTHWLRHTHATRAVERGVGADVLQANMGHADPRTTAGYFKSQLDRRRDEMERVYGGAST